MKYNLFLENKFHVISIFNAVRILSYDNQLILNLSLVGNDHIRQKLDSVKKKGNKVTNQT